MIRLGRAVWPGSVSDRHSVINLGDRKFVSLQLPSDPSFDKRQRRRLLAILRHGFAPQFCCQVTKDNGTSHPMV